MEGLLFILGYVFGFVVSLMLMHKYKKQLGIDNYDPPHESYYDDWDSNAEAYIWFSLGWPLWWFIMLIVFLYKQLLRFSKYIGNDKN
jgi:hypothetical protein